MHVQGVLLSLWDIVKFCGLRRVRLLSGVFLRRGRIMYVVNTAVLRPCVAGFSC